MLAGGILQLDVSKIPNKSEELSAAIRVTVNNGAEVELEQQTVDYPEAIFAVLPDIKNVQNGEPPFLEALKDR